MAGTGWTTRAAGEPPDGSNARSEADSTDGVGGSGGVTDPLRARIAALEVAVLAMRREVRTRRLVVTDDSGSARVVVEVTGGTAELRMAVEQDRRRAGHSRGRTAVVLHAGVDAGGSRPQEAALGALMGLQLWADGDAIAELDAWPDADGRWRPHLHLGAPW